MYTLKRKFKGYLLSTKIFEFYFHWAPRRWHSTRKCRKRNPERLTGSTYNFIISTLTSLGFEARTPLSLVLRRVINILPQFLRAIDSKRLHWGHLFGENVRNPWWNLIYLHSFLPWIYIEKTLGIHGGPVSICILFFPESMLSFL